MVVGCKVGHSPVVGHNLAAVEVDIVVEDNYCIEGSLDCMEVGRTYFVEEIKLVFLV
jgi:hypothetical protein